MQKDYKVHRVKHDVHRVGNHLVVGNDAVGYLVAELSRDSRFDDREEAFEFVVEQKREMTDSRFIDVRRRGW